MGGLGSGRPSGSGRGRVEGCRAIDVNRLKREGCLRPGRWSSWQWSRDGEAVASIQLRAEESQLHLHYRYRRHGGEWIKIEEPIPIVQVPCRFGGTRPYLICPGIVNGRACRRRVLKLYGADRYFLCRHCYRLGYAGQSEDELDRKRRRADRIRSRLGGEPGVLSRFPDRPKGMWKRTYERLREEAWTAEMQAEELFDIKAAQLLGRLDRRDRKGSFWQ